WEAKKGESDEVQLLRPELLQIAGDQGNDPQILAEARKRAEAWLRDHASVDAEIAGVALRLAASRGDAALFDSLHDAARAEKDRRDRQLLLGAMASFRDPALAKKA